MPASRSRRYHRFYEAPTASASVPHRSPTMTPMYPHPAMYAFPQQSMIFQPSMPIGFYHLPSRSSLMVPSQHLGSTHRRRMA